MDTNILQVSGVSRSFGKTQALKDLDVAIPKGKIVGLLGRNGAGKSTLLRIVGGMLKPSTGSVRINDQKVWDHAKALGQLCIIGDTPDFGKLAKIKDIFYVCGGLFPAWDNALALELVKRFELPQNRRVKTFSRGMQTGLMLAMGLASNAPFTIIDEPSLGLDAVMRERFYDLLLEEKQKDPNRTFLISTHLIDEVARALDYAVMIDDGHLLCKGTVQELQAGYLSVSGDADVVRELTADGDLLKEEELAGTLVRHMKLDAETIARIQGDARVRTAPIGLQRLFVFLTEAKEAERNG
ncbi:MAG TPA: ABC transporter ATP-binding protein [Candidatus Limiplasma sp.]|nr:ABC transporter ATP-binding protein [Candidatus Limiplasma sp.]